MKKYVIIKEGPDGISFVSSGGKAKMFDNKLLADDYAVTRMSCWTVVEITLRDYKYYDGDETKFWMTTKLI